MAFKSQAGPMDFDWDNGTGPVDPTSPYARFTQAQQQQQRQQQTDNLAKKRPHSVFNSPSKSSNWPSLRDPATQNASFLFSPPPGSPNKPLPNKPLPNNPAFNTPRKLDPPNYDSSEVDASSPEYNADSDATPDNFKMGFRSGMAQAGSALTRLITPEKKNPVFSRLAHGVPGRGELTKAPYSHKAEKRIQKSRSRVGGRSLIRYKKNELDSEDDAEQKGASKAKGQTGPGVIASVFSFIHMHPDLPHILSFYAQLLLNVFLVCFFIFIVYSFWATIRADVDKKSEAAIAELLVEMAGCARSYQENRCSPDMRAPALEAVCSNWEKCMNRDPNAVGRARVSAHTFAEIFNDFIEPISWKAMIFTLALVFGSLGISNFAFGIFRNKSHPPPPPTPAYMPTPQRQPNTAQDYAWNAYQSPMRRYGDPDDMMLENSRSPVRKLQM